MALGTPLRFGVEKLLIYFSVFGLAAVCAVFVFLLHSSYEDTKRQATEAANNLTTIVDQDISRNIELYNLSLQSVIDGYANPAVMALEPSLRQLTLFERSVAADGLGSIVLFDAHGDAVLSSESEVPPQLNVSALDFFQIHKRARGDIGLYVSHPFQSRLHQDQWLIGLSRRLNDAGGNFAGVITGTIRVSYFQNLFRRLTLGDKGVAVLFHEDGTIISRTPEDVLFTGQNVGHVIALFDHYKRSRSGSFEANAIDGVNRLYGYRQISKLPLVFTVGIATSEIFSEWRRRAVLTAASLLGLCCAGLALTMWLRSELKRRRLAEAAFSRLATIDKLTSLPNRRSFDELLDKERSRAGRNGEPLSILMIDADYFKAYNDSYGHLRGDAVLGSIAKCLTAACGRVADFPARFGGEEFAVLLPNTDLSGALAVAERIRSAVSKQNIPHAGSSFGHVTVSIGAACVSGSAKGVDELVHDADQALYAAKAAGRNCIRPLDRSSNIVSLNLVK